MTGGHTCTVITGLDDGIYCNHLRQSRILASNNIELSYYSDMADLVIHQLFYYLRNYNSDFFMKLGTLDELHNVTDEYNAIKDYYDGEIGMAVFAIVAVNGGKMDHSISTLKAMLKEKKRHAQIKRIESMNDLERLTCSSLRFRAGSNKTTWAGCLYTTPYKYFTAISINNTMYSDMILVNEESRTAVAKLLRLASEHTFHTVKHLNKFLHYRFMYGMNDNVEKLFKLVVIGHILLLQGKTEVQDILGTAIYNAGLELAGGYYVNKR